MKRKGKGAGGAAAASRHRAKKTDRVDALLPRRDATAVQVGARTFHFHKAMTRSCETVAFLTKHQSKEREERERARERARERERESKAPNIPMAGRMAHM